MEILLKKKKNDNFQFITQNRGLPSVITLHRETAVDKKYLPPIASEGGIFIISDNSGG